MSTTLSSSDHDANLKALQRLFADCQYDIIVHGSFARQEYPIDDIDAWAIGPLDQESMSTLPPAFRGISIAYNVHSPAQLAEMARVGLRFWYIFLDGIHLHRANPKTRSVFLAGQAYVGAHMADWIHFLPYDERLSASRLDLVDLSDYYTRKCLPGSRRSIMRVAWLLKAMHPYLRTVRRTQDIIKMAADYGHLPVYAPEDCLSVLRMIMQSSIDWREWFAITDRVRVWTQEVMDTALVYSSKQLPTDYISLLANASRQDATSQELSNMIEYTNQHLRDHRHWFATLLIAANPNLSSLEALNLLQDAMNRFGYKTIIRFLVRNPALPLDEVNLERLRQYADMSKLLSQRATIVRRVSGDPAHS